VDLLYWAKGRENPGHLLFILVPLWNWLENWSKMMCHKTYYRSIRGSPQGQLVSMLKIRRLKGQSLSWVRIPKCLRNLRSPERVKKVNRAQGKLYTTRTNTTTWRRKLIRNYIMKRRIMSIRESWILWWTSSQLGIWISSIMDLSILDRIPNQKVLAPDQGILKANLTCLKTPSLILEVNLI
jgi:hypothetical protein